MKKIGIIGSTGMLGQPVTNAFIRQEYEVSLLVRDLAKAKRIFGSTVRLVEGDLSDLKSLERFLKNQDALYLNLSVKQESAEKDFQPEREGLQNIMSVIPDSAIKRIGYLSSLVQLYQGMNGFDWWVFRVKQEAVQIIKNGGIPYSIFYPSTFMENFDKGAYKQGNLITLAGTSMHKMYFISGNDYAEQVVNAFKLNNGNREYIVQGLQGFTADEAAKLFKENYKKQSLKIIKTPLGLLSFLGRFNNKFNYAAHIIEALNNYPEEFAAQNTWNELGKPATSFIDYIKGSSSMNATNFK